ncbi:MAG: DUF5655 domain-containing protein [Bacteroidota bacterium]
MCNDLTVEDLFENKPDDLLLAFDEVLLATADWEPNSVGAASKSIVFTNKRAWLIVKPMSKLLEISFYTAGPLSGSAIHKSAPFVGSLTRFRHSIRLSGPGELTPEIVDFLKMGFDYANR